MREMFADETVLARPLTDDKMGTPPALRGAPPTRLLAAPDGTVWLASRRGVWPLRRLRAVSRATYARSGRVTLGPSDSGQSGAVWHRLQIEASVPDHAGLRIWAHADDGGAIPGAPGGPGAPDWAPHLVGAAARLDDQPDAPRASWCDTPSEFPFSPGLSP